MNKRFTATITLAAFLANTAISDVAFAQELTQRCAKDTLAIASRFDDIVGAESKKAATIEMLVAQFIAASHRSSMPIDRNGLAKFSGMAHLGGTRFFPREMTQDTPDSPWRLMARASSSGADTNITTRPSTYYVDIAPDGSSINVSRASTSGASSDETEEPAFDRHELTGIAESIAYNIIEGSRWQMENSIREMFEFSGPALDFLKEKIVDDLISRAAANPHGESALISQIVVCESLDVSGQVGFRPVKEFKEKWDRLTKIDRFKLSVTFAIRGSHSSSSKQNIIEIFNYSDLPYSEKIRALYALEKETPRVVELQLIQDAIVTMEEGYEENIDALIACSESDSVYVYLFDRDGMEDYLRSGPYDTGEEFVSVQVKFRYIVGDMIARRKDMTELLRTASITAIPIHIPRSDEMKAGTRPLFEYEASSGMKGTGASDINEIGDAISSGREMVVRALHVTRAMGEDGRVINGMQVSIRKDSNIGGFIEAKEGVDFTGMAGKDARVRPIDIMTGGNNEPVVLFEYIATLPSADEMLDELEAIKKREETIEVEVSGVVSDAHGEPFGLKVNYNGRHAGLIHKRNMFSSGRVPAVSVLEHYVGKSIEVKVVEIDRMKRRAEFSAASAAKGKIEAGRKAFFASLTVGQEVTGVVKNKIEGGVFVNLAPGVDGFIPKSELAWSKQEEALSLTKTGMRVTCKVIDFNTEEGKVTLSRKAMLSDEWEVSAKRFHTGDLVKGKVTSVRPNGVVVDLGGGIETFISLGQIGAAIGTLRRDNEIDLVVTRILPKEHKILCSYEEAKKRREIAETHTVMERLGGTTKRTLGDVLDSPAPDKTLAVQSEKVRVEGKKFESAVSVEVEGLPDSMFNYMDIVYAGPSGTGKPIDTVESLLLVLEKKYPLFGKVARIEEAQTSEDGDIWVYTHTRTTTSMREFNPLDKLHITVTRARKMVSTDDLDFALEPRDTVVIADKAETSARASSSGSDASEASRKLAWSDFHVGDTVRGYVERIQPYGLFVNVNGPCNALLHASDVSWGWADDLSGMFKRGERIEAVVTEVDEAEKRLSLSTKGEAPLDEFNELIGEDALLRATIPRDIPYKVGDDGILARFSVPLPIGRVTQFTGVLWENRLLKPISDYGPGDELRVVIGQEVTVKERYKPSGRSTKTLSIILQEVGDTLVNRADSTSSVDAEAFRMNLRPKVEDAVGVYLEQYAIEPFFRLMGEYFKQPGSINEAVQIVVDKMVEMAIEDPGHTDGIKNLAVDYSFNFKYDDAAASLHPKFAAQLAMRYLLHDDFAGAARALFAGNESGDSRLSEFFGILYQDMPNEYSDIDDIKGLLSNLRRAGDIRFSLFRKFVVYELLKKMGSGQPVKMMVTEFARRRERSHAGPNDDISGLKLAYRGEEAGFMPRGAVQNANPKGNVIEVMGGLIGSEITVRVIGVGKGNDDAIVAPIFRASTSGSGASEALQRLAWGDIHAGDRVNGYVRNIAPYGVFIDINGPRDALLHVSEMEWGWSSDFSERFKMGDPIEAVITEVSEGEKQLRLSTKGDAPLDELRKLMDENTVLRGTIPSDVPYVVKDNEGVIVRFSVPSPIGGATQFTGVVWKWGLRSPIKSYSPGDELRLVMDSARVKEHSKKSGRPSKTLNVTLEEVSDTPINRSTPTAKLGRYKWGSLKPGMEVQGKVIKVRDYGAIIDFNGPCRGLLHVSEMGSEGSARPSDIVAVGDEITMWIRKAYIEEGKQRRVQLTLIPPSLRASSSGTNVEAEIRAMKPVAHEAGLEISARMLDQIPTLIVDMHLFKGEDRQKDIEGYDLPGGKRIAAGDRIDLKAADTSSVDNVLSNIDKSKAGQTIVQITGNWTDADLKRLKAEAPGIRIVKVDTTDAMDGKPDERRDFRFDLYAYMLAARAVTLEDIQRQNEIYRALEFFIKAHMEGDIKDVETAAAKYISALVDNEKGLSRIITYNLSYRPTGRWATPNYHIVAVTLISA